MVRAESDETARQHLSNKGSDMISKNPVTDKGTGTTACLALNTVGVVVTYGSRVTMAVETLARIFASGIEVAVLVDNGLRPSVQSELTVQLAGLSGRVVVERLETNQGSAAGFEAGVRRATEVGAKYLWLLDDDNHPQPGAFASASGALNRLQTEDTRVAISCLRTADPSHMRIAQGESAFEVYPQAGEFFGFDLIARLLALVKRRRGDGGSVPVSEGHEIAALIPMAPYGGLLVAVADIEKVGKPDGRFILYCDDYDFTQRLVQDGVQLTLLTSARVDDAGQRWETEAAQGNMTSMVLNSSRWRSYYLYRNLRVLEGRQARRDGKLLRFFLNGCAYSATLLARSLLLRKPGFFGLFLEAQSDGRKGRLGLKYDLPQ